MLLVGLFSEVTPKHLVLVLEYLRLQCDQWRQSLQHVNPQHVNPQHEDPPQHAHQQGLNQQGLPAPVPRARTYLSSEWCMQMYYYVFLFDNLWTMQNCNWCKGKYLYNYFSQLLITFTSDQTTIHTNIITYSKRYPRWISQGGVTHN